MLRRALRVRLLFLSFCHKIRLLLSLVQHFDFVALTEVKEEVRFIWKCLGMESVVDDCCWFGVILIVVMVSCSEY